MEKFESQLPYTYKQQKEHFSLEEYFDLKKLIDVINQTQAKETLIQFPVFQLAEAIQVQSYLSKNSKCKVSVLSDHLKQSCCVDIVGASHLNFDLIIHFGQACFSEKYNEKVFYVLPKIKLDVEIVSSELKKYFQENQNSQTIIVFDQEYSYLQEQFMAFNEEFSNCNIALINDLKNCNENNQLFYGYQTSKLLDQEREKNLILISSCENSKLVEKLFFIKEKFKIQNIKILQDNYLRDVNFRINTSIMKRLHLIEEARNIDCFGTLNNQKYKYLGQKKLYLKGILITNPNTKFCQNVWKKCRTLIKQANKKCFSFVMNNLTEAKLNNFPEVDGYVIISCHNNSLFEYKQFYKLLITPYELELALSDQSYSSHFIIDGSNMEEFVESNNNQQCKENKTQSCKSDSNCKCQNNANTCCKKSSENEEQKEEEIEVGEVLQNALVLKEEKDYQVASQKIFQTLDFFKNRLYQGLDINQEKEVTLAKQGLSGIASQYVHEKQ